MIYVIAFAFLIASVGFYRKMRSAGLLSTLIDTVAAALIGWISGILIGVGARVGMWSIPFFNGTDSRFTLDGSVQVILVFSLFGIGLGILYELLFRQLVRNHGIVYGLLITVIAAFPLAQAALQQISFTPTVVAAALSSLLFVGFMFIPFAVSLEFLLGLYHSFRAGRANLAKSH